MTNYLARSRTPNQWWADLSPLLTSEAQYTVQGTNPWNIPASKITGELIVEGTSSTSATVLVPTDAGQYRLDMTEQVEDGARGPWLVYTFTPPAQTPAG